MSERSLKQLQLILKNLDGGAWSRLGPFHLSVFRSLHARRINYPFLHTLAQFWDPQNHVFRFNTVELCPLPEEFEAILGSRMSSDCQIVVPLVHTPDLHSVQYQMARLFNLPPHLSLQHIFGDEISMDSLLQAVTSTDSTETQWPRTLAACLYAQFLFVSLSGNCDLKLLHILDQVEDGLNPFPLILGETIAGLDDFAETKRFRGSPMLLEVISFFLALAFIILPLLLI